MNLYAMLERILTGISRSSRRAQAVRDADVTAVDHATVAFEHAKVGIMLADVANTVGVGEDIGIFLPLTRRPLEILIAAGENGFGDLKVKGRLLV